MNILKFLMTLIIILSSLSLWGQSVDDLIELALQYNPGLKAMQLEYQSAMQKKDQVTDYPDPSLSLGIGVLPIETRLGAQILRLGVAQPIPWKGLLKGRSEVMKAQADRMDESRKGRFPYGRTLWVQSRKSG